MQYKEWYKNHNTTDDFFYFSSLSPSFQYFARRGEECYQVQKVMKDKTFDFEYVDITIELTFFGVNFAQWLHVKPSEIGRNPVHPLNSQDLM